ncbi:hypothetical protein LP421_10575 [Rhizobium sp. RCAM05350]|nr:hypothetical protein LP421_10575 [Rhizobium sp. RCAM05350]
MDDRDEYTAPEEGKSKAQTERQRNEGEQWKQAIIGAMRWQLEQPKMKAEIDAGRDVCVGMATINQGACNDVDPGDRKSKATKKTAFHRAVNDLIKEGVLIKDTTEDNAVVLGPRREWPVT